MKYLEWLLSENKIDEFKSEVAKDTAILSVRIRGGDPLFTTAIFVRDLQLLAWLVENGADVNQQGSGGYIPIEHAIDEAAEKSDFTLFDWLLNHGAESTARGSQTWTALHAAAARGCLAAIKTLVERGANLEARQEIDGGWTPLQTAVFAGHEAVVEYLLIKNADATVRDGMFGWTLEEMAMEQGHKRIVDLIRTYAR